MIRLLQQDNRIMKIILAVIMGLAAITMVITLVPGIFDNSGGANDATGYATVREPGFFGRTIGESRPIKAVEVNQLAARQLQQQHLPEALMPYLLPRAGQILVQRAILKHEADRMNRQVSDEDLRRELQTGPFAQYLFPNGNYIGDEAYINFVSTAFGNQLSRAEFESQVKSDMELNRLQALITGGVTVSDNAVREAYKVGGPKVKFDYVVISADDVRKGINPSDADLQAFFKSNAARYATAIPEARKIQYVSFDASNLPGGKPQISDADVQAYYNAHKDQHQVKAEIVPILEQQRAGAAEQTFASSLAADAKKNGMDKAAAAKGLHVVTTDFVAKDGVIPGLADGSGLLSQAFAVVKGADPASVSTGEGFAVFQVTDIKPAHAPEFAEYKAHILEDYREQQVPQLMNAQLNKLDERAKVLNDLKKAAAEMNLPMKTSDLGGKDAQVPELGAMSGPGSVAFSLAKGAISGPINTGRSGVVLSVVDKQEPTAEDIAKNFIATRERLLNEQHEEIFRVYIGELTQKYEKGGAVRYSQKQPAPGSAPFGN